ncbi:MAG: YqaJ viral recombinase family protein [Bacteroidaceae bacterium]|nr:YqaJ viral recombinase family protein [Bacteroidaceae bacterium]
MAITKVKTANHEEWKALRSNYIGGSDAAAVVGLNPFSSRYSLWAEKTGRIPGFEGNLATEVGTFLEEFVAQKFAAETGKKVRRDNQSFLNSDYPWAIANIDRDIVGEDAGLEIKTTSELNLKKFKGGEYPANYYAQMVHYMAITGKKRWYLAVLIGNREFKWFTLERDEDEIAALMEAEKDFWRLVETDTPPEADGMEATSEAIKTIYPESNGSTVDLYIYRAELARYLSLTKQIKELEGFRDESANTVKAFLGDAERGECEGFKASWKTQTRRTFDGKAFMADHPEMDFSGYYKESSTRVFRVTEQKGA